MANYHCIIKEKTVEETDETVFVAYISSGFADPSELSEVHNWINENYPNNEMLVFGYQYLLSSDYEDFEFAFKLRWG